MEKRIALCIGNDNYQYMGRLLCAINDADEMGEVFRRLGYDTIIKHDLDRTQFGEVIFDFTERVKDYSACVFYYAGHGFEVNSQNLLVPVDLNYSSLSRDQEIIYNSFLLNDLIDELNKYEDIVKIIILDACRQVKSVRGVNLGFGPIAAPKGYMIAFSTSPGEGAMEDGGRHGKYTNTLLKYMECSLTIEEIFKRVRRDMDVLTNGRQIPWVHTSLIGDFYFDRIYCKKIVTVNYIDSVRIMSQHKSKDIWTGKSMIAKTVKSIYPVIEADNYFVPKSSANICAIQKQIDIIYEKIYKEWEEWFDLSETNESVLHSSDPLEDGVGYEVFFNQEGILCICIDRYLYKGGCHGMPSKIVKTFDLNSGKELSLRSLVAKSDADIMSLVNSRLAEEKIIHESERPIIYSDFTMEEYHSVDDLKWYLDADGIHIYFDIYEAGSYSEGYIEYVLTDQVFFEKNGMMKRLELINRKAKQDLIDELTMVYQDRYAILLHRVIGMIEYEIMAVGFPPINKTTFWLIKCVKYKTYNKGEMESFISELVRMKKNYEVITGNLAIAVLYIIWDEDEESEIVAESYKQFETIVLHQSNGDGLQFESLLIKSQV